LVLLLGARLGLGVGAGLWAEAGVGVDAEVEALGGVGAGVLYTGLETSVGVSVGEGVLVVQGLDLVLLLEQGRGGRKLVLMSEFVRGVHVKVSERVVDFVVSIF
jgi:hypothetical protein